MKKVKSLLKELGFEVVQDPYVGSRLINVSYPDLWDLRGRCQEIFKKERTTDISVPGAFVAIVGFINVGVLIQACQMISMEDRKADSRLKNTGLVWFQEAFATEDEENALLFIRKMSDSHEGPLYGNCLPAPK